ncbi:MAG TPA: hypothetical protein VGM01_02600 [Ktedonobacteraceae bacterium]|jgi:hypothetical protein
MVNSSLFPAGNRVRVTSHGPFRGLNGIIRQIDSIVDDLDDPFCFYLIELERASIAEAIWFEYHEVEFIGVPPLILPSKVQANNTERKQKTLA